MRGIVNRILSIIILLSASPALIHAAEADSIVAHTPEQPHKNWVKQLIATNFEINNPSINYPKFARFIVKVYNWGDRTFNSYDPEYVVNVGKNWKLTGNSYNWGESNVLYFQDRNYIRMYSSIYSDVGANLGFMALNIGYTINANNLIGNPTNYRKNMRYSFTCGLFAANVIRTDTRGGMKITHFGERKLNKRLAFNNIYQSNTEVDLYYFFNNKRYSQAAAYCYSKYQLKSAGSFIAGLNYGKQSIDLDFSQLPAELAAEMPGNHMKYNFNYNSYNILFGYAYNWVLHPRRWLINATMLPSVGYKHSYEDSTDGKKDMFSLTAKAMLAVVYNHRSLFASLNGRMDGHVHFGNGYTFFNSIESVTFNVGMRF